MELFEMVNGYVVPSVHSLIIQPFKDIWNTDTSSNNIESTKIFTYIELMCSPKKSNPFIGIPEEERSEKVKEEVWKDEDYRITDTIMFAVLKYKELLSIASPSYDLYVSAANAVQKLKAFLDDFDMEDKTRGGTLVLKPKDITSALKDIEDVGKNLELARNRVHSEVIQANKTRNQREINDFER